MDALTRRARKDEIEARRRLLQEYREVRDGFISDVLAGRRDAELFSKRIWKLLWLGAIPVPYCFRTRTVIDIQVQKTYSNLRLTTAGRLVHPPGMFTTVWSGVNRSFEARSYTNELDEMIAVLAAPIK